MHNCIYPSLPSSDGEWDWDNYSIVVLSQRKDLASSAIAPVKVNVWCAIGNTVTVVHSHMLRMEVCVWQQIKDSFLCPRMCLHTCCADVIVCVYHVQGRHARVRIISSSFQGNIHRPCPEASAGQPDGDCWRRRLDLVHLRLHCQTIPCHHLHTHAGPGYCSIHSQDPWCVDYTSRCVVF